MLPNHVLPPPEELKNKKWCKRHNTHSHCTNKCSVFKQEIQCSIEQGRLKFDNQKMLMKVDGNPFPLNMIGESTTLIKKYQNKWGRKYRLDQV
jgi:hypothetical protein